MSFPDRSERERARIARAVDRIKKDGPPTATWFLAFTIVVAVFAVGVWIHGWLQFRAQAHAHNMSVSQVQQLSGGQGHPLTANEADLVRFCWVLEYTSLVVVLIMFAPLAVVLAYRAGRFQAKVFLRLVALGGP